MEVGLQVRIIKRKGWRMAVIRVEISDYCPECGAKRGNPQPHTFYEDGDWYVCDQWHNPCNHVDDYVSVWNEAYQLLQTRKQTLELQGGMNV